MFANDRKGGDCTERIELKRDLGELQDRKEDICDGSRRSPRIVGSAYDLSMQICILSDIKIN